MQIYRRNFDVVLLENRLHIGHAASRMSRQTPTVNLVDPTLQSPHPDLRCARRLKDTHHGALAGKLREELSGKLREEELAGKLRAEELARMLRAEELAGKLRVEELPGTYRKVEREHLLT